MLLQQGRPAEAAAHFQRAVEISPDFLEAHRRLADVSLNSGKSEEALLQYTEVLRLNPDLPDALNNVAWIRATSADPALRDGIEAVHLAERACRLTQFKQPLLLGTLAAAYAEAGQFVDAERTARQAHDLALANGDTVLAEKDQAMLSLFTSRQPFRESKP